MLLNLVGHASANYQCTCNTFVPKNWQETTLNRLDANSKEQWMKVSSWIQSTTWTLISFPCWFCWFILTITTLTTPIFVKSCTSFVILVASCSIFCMSKLQIEIAFSTVKAEYVALSTAFKELFPLINIIKFLWGAIKQLIIKNTMNMLIIFHKKNISAHAFESLELHWMTSGSKHNPIKYHCFREKK